MIMYSDKLDDRPERELDRIFNPSAPLTEESLESFTEEAPMLLLERLNQLEAGRNISP